MNKSWILRVFGIIVLCLLVYDGLWAIYKADTPYDPREVRYAVSEVDVKLNVEILDTRKEKDKEIYYEVAFKDLAKKQKSFVKTLTQSEFDSIVGEGNNTLSSKVYSADLYIRERVAVGFYAYYVLHMDSYECFGGVPYVKETVSYTGPTLVDFATNKADFLKPETKVLGENRHVQSDVLYMVKTYTIDSNESKTEPLHGANQYKEGVESKRHTWFLERLFK